MTDLDWTAAYRSEDLQPSDRDLPGEDVDTSNGPMRAVGPQHVISGAGTLCGIPVADVEVMPFLFSPRYKNLCPECCRKLGGGVEVRVTANTDRPNAEELSADRELVGDFSVDFSDIAAQRQHLVEQSLAFIRDFPGVERVVQEDREIIYGWGRSVDLVALHEALAAWWSNHLRPPRKTS